MKDNRSIAAISAAALTLVLGFSNNAVAKGGREVDLSTHCNASEDRVPDCTSSDPIGVVAGDFRGAYKFTANRNGNRRTDELRARVKLPNVPQNQDAAITVSLFASGVDPSSGAAYAQCLLDFDNGKAGAEYRLLIRREVRLDRPDRDKLRNVHGECSLLPSLVEQTVQPGDIAVFSGVASDGTTILFKDIVAPAF